MIHLLVIIEIIFPLSTVHITLFNDYGLPLGLSILHVLMDHEVGGSSPSVAPTSLDKTITTLNPGVVNGYMLGRISFKCWIALLKLG